MIGCVYFTFILLFHRCKWMLLSVLSVQDGNPSDGFVNCGGGEKFIGCFFPRQINFVSGYSVSINELFLYLMLIFSPELVASEFKVDVELYQSQLAENNAKSPSTPVKVFKKLKKVCNELY